MMLMAAFGLFIETLGRGKTTKITKIYSSVFLFFSLTQFFFSPRYSDNVMQIWEYTILIYYSYVFFYDVVYFYFFDKKGPQKSNTNNDLDALIFNILIGTFAIFICGIYEILSSIFLSISFSLFVYSAFVVQIGMTFSLSQRFSSMYKRLEESNSMLEIAVHERTVELERQTEIAVQANLAKSQFLATMSHEIRTPLNAVIGLSEIVLRRGKLLEASRNDIRQIHQSGSSLLGIINDILDISKIEAKSFELVPVAYETASLLSDTLMLNRVRIGSRPIALALEIGGDFPLTLVGDELRIKQVLNNLLSNAIKYTKEGSVTLSAAWGGLAGRENEALIRLSVRDTGIGIRREDIKRLFSGYTQLDTRANRAIEGTGLGLEITKKLVEMMGGSIAVDSEHGKGSVFTAEIVQGIADYRPIGEETAEKLRGFNYTAGTRGDGIDRSWMPYGKVLVVDDLPVNLQIARGLLEPYGLQVDSAESGRKAVEMVRAENPRYDLIFMDHMMPEMDGMEAARIIREESGSEYGRNVPIVALTANALVGTPEMFLSKGFSGFISKPVDIFQLDEALNKFIRDKRGEGDGERGTGIGAGGQGELPMRPDGGPQPPFPAIPGVDVKKGIAMTGGTEKGYRSVLAALRKDVEERLPLFRAVPEPDALPAFAARAHSLKSSTASVGAAEVSARAERLEAAGRAGDLAFVREHLGDFSERLAALAENIGAALQAASGGGGAPGIPSYQGRETGAQTARLFRDLAESLKSRKVPEIRRALGALGRQAADPRAREALETISDQVLMAEFDDAAKTAEEFAAAGGEG
jgi:signal transduction histidine kinase/ActR/RegA family two-component response regulator/HPt (histidine-containing phosphotransfer) domain-containing protein